MAAGSRFEYIDGSEYQGALVRRMSTSGLYLAGGIMIRHLSSRRLALSSLAFSAALVAAASPALAGDGTNLYPMLPAETQIMFVFDVADARDSPLLLKGFEKLLAAKPEAKAKLAEIGIDPTRDIDTLAFVGGGVKDMDEMSDGPKSMVIVIEGRLPKDRLAQIPDARKSSYKGIDIFTNADTDAAFVGERLFFTRKGKMKAQIDLAQGRAKAKSIAGSTKAKKLRDALLATDTSADIWMTVMLPDANKKDITTQVPDLVVNSVSAGVNFTKDLGIAVRADTASESGARKAIEMINGALAQATSTMGTIGLGKAAKSITVVQDKAAIKVGLTLTEAEINSLMGLAGLAGAGSQPPPPPPSKAAPAPRAAPAPGKAAPVTK
jgi:hypothetical protein